MNPFDAFRSAWEALFFECPQVEAVVPLRKGSMHSIFFVHSPDGTFMMEIKKKVPSEGSSRMEVNGDVDDSNPTEKGAEKLLGVVDFKTHRVHLYKGPVDDGEIS